MNTEPNITDNQADVIIVRPGRLIMLLLGGVIRKTVAKLINRAFERGKINSHSYHELHAMAVRVFGPTNQQAKMLLPPQ